MNRLDCFAQGKNLDTAMVQQNGPMAAGVRSGVRVLDRSLPMNLVLYSYSNVTLTVPRSLMAADAASPATTNAAVV